MPSFPDAPRQRRFAPNDRPLSKPKKAESRRAGGPFADPDSCELAELNEAGARFIAAKPTATT